VSGLGGETSITGLVANEKNTLETQAGILNNQLKLLRAQKPRIQAELEALNAQVATTTKQLDLVRQHADQYTRLVKQGLGLSTSEMQFRLTEATQENELWRLKAQISRLQMDAGDLDLKIEEAEAAFKRQIVAELWSVRDRLSEFEVTLPAAQKIRDVKLQYAGDVMKIGVKHSISITRVINGESTVVEAIGTTPLEPGDVIEVKRLLPDSVGLENTSASQLDLQAYPKAEASTLGSVNSTAR
jgi:polysaccharide export outer membrane protein